MFNIYCTDYMSDEPFIAQSYFSYEKARTETQRLNHIEQAMEKACCESGEEYLNVSYYLKEEHFGKHPEDAHFKMELSLVPLTKGVMLLIDPENHYSDGWLFETEQQAREWARSIGFKIA